MKPYEPFASHLVPMLLPNIDTDQIYPARFLTTASKTGLEGSLFRDLRFEADGTPKPDFILNTERGRTAKILLAGENFGCGSSREHAPWALVQFGIRAVISTSFADIFRANALKNSLLPIVVSAAVHAELADATVAVDLASQTIRWGADREASFPIDAFSKACLLEGVDELEWILNRADAIDRFERRSDRC